MHQNGVIPVFHVTKVNTGKCFGTLGAGGTGLAGHWGGGTAADIIVNLVIALITTACEAFMPKKAPIRGKPSMCWGTRLTQ